MDATITMYTSPDCQPCRKLKPVVAELTAQRGITINEIDIYAQPELASAAGVMSVPTLVIGDQMVPPAKARPKAIAALLDELVGG